jgi:CheY-like chemotaxis protein
MMLQLAGVIVLVVDDDPDLRTLFRIWLEYAGAKVVLAEDGLEALHMLVEAQARRALPDVIFCDIKMPRLDGCGFLQRMREELGLSRIPVIAVSGSGSEKALLRTLEMGFRGHLLKPVTPLALAAQVSRAMLGSGD